MFGGTAPNVYRVLGTNPAALRAFVETEHALETQGQLGLAEHAIVALEVAVHSGCTYCETVFVNEAHRHGVADDAVHAICAGETPRPERERLLVRATRRLMATHGRLGRHEIADFAEQGLGKAELLEIITIIAGYTLASYTNNLMRTRLDPELRLPPPADDAAER